MVAIVPTKTSRAANEVISEIPIFQSNPNGAMAGSIDLPRIPAYDASNFSEAILFSFSSEISLEYFFSIFSNRSPGACDDKNQRMIETATITFPASHKNTFTLSIIVIPIEDQRGE